MAKKDYTGMSQRDFDVAQSSLGVAPVEAPNKRVAMAPMDKQGVNDIIGTEGARAGSRGGGGKAVSPKLSLEQRRIQKAEKIMSEAERDYGNKKLTLDEMESLLFSKTNWKEKDITHTISNMSYPDRGFSGNLGKKEWNFPTIGGLWD